MIQHRQSSELRTVLLLARRPIRRSLGTKESARTRSSNQKAQYHGQFQSRQKMRTGVPIAKYDSVPKTAPELCIKESKPWRVTNAGLRFSSANVQDQGERQNWVENHGKILSNG